MNVKNIIKYCGVSLLCTTVGLGTLNSCTEKIDDSNLYTFTGEMMTDHFANNPEKFSSFLELLGKVHSSKKSSSTIRDILSARGHYTCFAPTNTAISTYLDSLCTAGVLSSPDIADITDSVAQAIVFNSIIENGDKFEPYASTDFVSDEPLNQPNMNDRYIKIVYGTEVSNIVGNDTAKITVIYVNGQSKIVDLDIEVENGYIHAIDHVISPSSSSIAELVKTTKDTQFFGELLTLTGWDEKMTMYKDESWEDNPLAGTDFSGKSGKWGGIYPEKRKIGYTIFVEPDEVYKNKGITDISSLKEWVKNNAHYDNDDCNTSLNIVTTWDSTYTDSCNWLNQFVAYHCLPEAMLPNQLVLYANDYSRYAGEEVNSNNNAVPVWEYWETLGVQRRSIKITGCKIDGTLEKRINRESVMYNSRNGSYRENAAAVTIPGIKIEDNYKDGTNGNFYYIDDILVWNEDVPKKVLNERLRYDITSLFPELLTNNIKYNKKNSWYLTEDYLDNVMEITNETEFEYLPNTNNTSSASEWVDYKTDEFNIRGVFDFTMKLPPVPYTGTYEIRYGIWANDKRGMAQIYLGKNWHNLPAVGIPIDLRDTSVEPSTTGWVSDDNQSEESINEITKTMRNLGYMKGPKYIKYNGGEARNLQRNLRKIIFTGQLEAGQTYYVRFKTVLEDDQKEFFYDYIELVPKSVYAGEDNSADESGKHSKYKGVEDVW